MLNQWKRLSHRFKVKKKYLQDKHHRSTYDVISFQKQLFHLVNNRVNSLYSIALIVVHVLESVCVFDVQSIVQHAFVSQH